MWFSEFRWRLSCTTVERERESVSKGRTMQPIFIFKSSFNGNVPRQKKVHERQDEGLSSSRWNKIKRKNQHWIYVCWTLYKGGKRHFGKNFASRISLSLTHPFPSMLIRLLLQDTDARVESWWNLDFESWTQWIDEMTTYYTWTCAYMICHNKRTKVRECWKKEGKRFSRKSRWTKTRENSRTQQTTVGMRANSNKNKRTLVFEYNISFRWFQCFARIEKQPTKILLF